MDYEWVEKAIRIENQKVYFFNSDKIYTKVSIKEALKMNLKGLKRDYYKISEYYNPEMTIKGPIARAILCLKVGDSLEKLKKDIVRFEDIYAENRENSIINKVYRINNGKCYFFNEELKWTCLKEEEILQTDIVLNNIRIKEGRKIKYNAESLRGNISQIIECDDLNVLKCALCKIKIGDTIEELKKCCKNITLGNKKETKEIERFITRIDRPKFICIPENPNKDTTFDYIHIDVNVRMQWEEDKRIYIEKHKKEISQLVLRKIESNIIFQKYKVPINCLKISKIIWRNSLNTLHYILELKNIK